MDFKNEISELIINSIKKSNDLKIASQSIANDVNETSNQSITSDNKTSNQSITSDNETNNQNMINLNRENIANFLETPKDKKNGDVSFPCFRLAKILKRSPIEIANIIKENIDIENTVVSKIDIVNGFLNFYIDKNKIAQSVISKFNINEETYGSSDEGKGKNVIVEYSSPNIAKPFHIGHLKTTILGNSLYNMYKFLGYNTIGINHLGDYGTQFAKLIVAYDKWKNEYDLSVDPITKLSEMYVRINKLCEEDENVLNECRNTFKKLENGDPHCVDIWKKFKEVSLAEFQKIYDLLGIKFDSMNGESFYSDKLNEVVELLEKSGKLEESNGAKIVDLSDVGIDTPCIIQKANGSSIYATRDLAAILYRARTYDFDKCLYVVGNEQTLHFKQVFAVAKYLGLDEKYLNGLEHVSYGMIRLPEGRMSTRKGNFVKVEDLLNDAISKANEIIKDRDIENKDEVAKKVGIAAVVFDNLKESRIKEQVFDVNKALNFSGETGPYIQYTVVRTNSILNKAGYIPKSEDVIPDKLTDDKSISLLKTIGKFNETISSALKKSEPFYVSRYLLDLSKQFSEFYNENKVICDDNDIQNARLYLTYMTKTTLTNGLKLLGIDVPEKM